jgi:hypothetical protein
MSIPQHWHGRWPIWYRGWSFFGNDVCAVDVARIGLAGVKGVEQPLHVWRDAPSRPVDSGLHTMYIEWENAAWDKNTLFLNDSRLFIFLAAVESFVWCCAWSAIQAYSFSSFCLRGAKLSYCSLPRYALEKMVFSGWVKLSYWKQWRFFFSSRLRICKAKLERNRTIGRRYTTQVQSVY